MVLTGVATSPPPLPSLRPPRFPHLLERGRLDRRQPHLAPALVGQLAHLLEAHLQRRQGLGADVAREGTRDRRGLGLVVIVEHDACTYDQHHTVQREPARSYRRASAEPKTSWSGAIPPRSHEGSMGAPVAGTLKKPLAPPIPRLWPHASEA